LPLDLLQMVDQSIYVIALRIRNFLADGADLIDQRVRA
jgi:hypothetical protein